MSRSTYLLISLVLVIFGYPFVASHSFGELILGILMATTPFAGVYAVSGRKRLRVASVVLGIPALAGIAAHFFVGADLADDRIFITMVFVYYAFTTTGVIMHLFRRKSVDIDTIVSAVAAYLMIGLTFATLHVIIGLSASDAYSSGALGGAKLWNEALYFSFVTLTTLGYGDISPVSPVARAMSTMEATTGVLYMGILIARLVADYQSSKSKGDADRDTV